LSHDSESWEVARDLYLQCLQADPQYAPAWARLGRVYHVIGKYRGAREENFTLSESALNRALELNPNLSIADRFYAQLEVADLGRAKEAMVRLVRRASSRSSDPELFGALVSSLPLLRSASVLAGGVRTGQAPRSERADQRAAHVFHGGRLLARGGRVRTALGTRQYWRPRVALRGAPGCRYAGAGRCGALREHVVSKQCVDLARTRSCALAISRRRADRLGLQRSRRLVLSGPEASSRRRRGSRRRNPRGRRRPRVLPLRDLHAPRMARLIAQSRGTSTRFCKGQSASTMTPARRLWQREGRRCWAAVDRVAQPANVDWCQTAQLQSLGQR
jgi:hypothetical protein